MPGGKKNVTAEAQSSPRARRELSASPRRPRRLCGFVPLVVPLALGLAACKTAEDEKLARAQRLEERYKLPPADARVAAEAYPELDTSTARSLFAQLTENVPGFERLATDDVGYFVASVKSADKGQTTLVPKLVAPATVELVKRLRETYPESYEPRIYEAEHLDNYARNPALIAGFFEPSVVANMKLVLARSKHARLPVWAAVPALELRGLPAARVERALDRFAELEVDAGVLEIDPQALYVLGLVAGSDARLEALTIVARHLRSLDPRRVTRDGLDAVAAIEREALPRVLSAVAPTRGFRRLDRLDRGVAAVLAELAKRPDAAALLAVLEAAFPDLAFEGEHDARALVTIDAASADGRALATLERAVSRGQLEVEYLDDATTALLVDLVSKPEDMEALGTLHRAFPAWHARPREREGIAALSSAPGLVPLLASIRQLGFDLSATRLTPGVARAIGDLAKDGAAELVEALHVIDPKIVVPSAAALHELHEIARAGVTAKDILRLDAGAVVGVLDGPTRASIVDQAVKRRASPSPPRR